MFVSYNKWNNKTLCWSVVFAIERDMCSVHIKGTYITERGIINYNIFIKTIGNQKTFKSTEQTKYKILFIVQ